ncbi:MAG TPA: hypothetical protein VIU29_01575 [Candidatus Deferrimicrobiaceae bacterium]
MIRKMIGMMMALSFVVLAGCGGGGSSSPPVFTGQILSNPSIGGDIEQVGGIFTPATSGLHQPLYGLQTGDEFRAFLTFPLDGSTGGSVIPVNARVVSADLELHISRCDIATVPTLLDLIAYSTRTGPVYATDFNSLPLTATSFRTFDIVRNTDLNNFVRIDVTPLVQDAIALGRNEVQFRLMYSLSAALQNGLVGFDDDPAIAATAPLLTISYE